VNIQESIDITSFPGAKAGGFNVSIYSKVNYTILHKW